MDGMNIVALILHRLCPQNKVDMHAEIRNIKKLALAQYDNNIHLFLQCYQQQEIGN
jgi:hypothetical protein